MLASLNVALVALAPQAQSEVVARVPEGVVMVAETLRFAPNGIKVAYVGQKGDRSHPVTGEVLGDAFDSVDAPVIDALGKHVAFRAVEEGKRHQEGSISVLYDGKKIATDDWIGPVSLSADGTPAFWMTHGWASNADGSRERGPATLVFGKKKSSKWQACDPVLAPVFSADGRFVCSVGTKDEGWAVLLLDRKGKEETHRGGHIVEVWPQPGGNEIVYTMLDLANGDPEDDEPHKYIVLRAVLNDRRKAALPTMLGRAYDSAGSPVYSPNGERVAFLALRGGKFGVVVDEDEVASCKFDFVDELTFDPEGEQLAYVASNGCELDESNGHQVLADMAEAEGGRWFVVFGTSQSAEFDRTKLPRWSPDGKSVAFAALEGEEWRVHAGETSSEAFDQIAEIRWASDGGSICFGAQREREISWNVLALE